MKYFKELSDEYLKKPFFIRSEWMNRIATSPIPNEFYAKHQSTFNRINDLSRDIDLVRFREVSRRLRDTKRSDDEDSDSEYRMLESKLSSIIKTLSYTYGDASYDTEKALCDLHERISLQENGRLFNKAMESLYSLSPREKQRKENEREFYAVRDLLTNYYELLQIIHMDKDGLLDDIGKAIEDLERYQLVTKVSWCNMYPLPGYWYIVPGFMGLDDTLYNALNKHGEKELHVVDILNKVLYGKRIYSEMSKNSYLEDAYELRKRDFVEDGEYWATIRYGSSRLHSHLLDCTGVPFGLHEKFQRGRIIALKKILEDTLLTLVPYDELGEFIEQLEEKSQYFNILDANNLPIGFHDIIMKIFTFLDKDTFDSKLLSQEEFDRWVKRAKKLAKFTPETYYNAAIYFALQDVLRCLNEELNMRLEDFECMPTRIYRPEVKTLVMGYHVAHARVINFFANLYQKAADYNECIEYLKGIPNEEILIRCCGFNKVIQQTKEIITSFINYEEEFSEYIKRGWRICFLPPIRLDENTNRLVDMSDFCKVKRFHEQ